MSSQINEIMAAICNKQAECINAPMNEQTTIFEKRLNGRRIALDQCCGMLQKCFTYRDAKYCEKSIGYLLKQSYMELAMYHHTMNIDGVTVHHGKMDVYKDLIELLHKNLNAYARGKTCPIMNYRRHEAGGLSCK